MKGQKWSPLKGKTNLVLILSYWLKTINYEHSGVSVFLFTSSFLNLTLFLRDLTISHIFCLFRGSWCFSEQKTAFFILVNKVARHWFVHHWLCVASASPDWLILLRWPHQLQYPVLFHLLHVLLFGEAAVTESTQFTSFSKGVSHFERTKNGLFLGFLLLFGEAHVGAICGIVRVEGSSLANVV